jgi:protein-disulfide isomerase
VSIFQRSLIALFLLCLGCSAQSKGPTDVNDRLERQIRAYYQLPYKYSIEIGARQPSEFPNYDLLNVSIITGERKQEEQFLISKDNKTLVRFAKMDLTKDPYADVMNKITIDHRPWRGNPDAKVVIVSYDDFQCPFCGRMHQQLFGDVYKNYSDKVKIVYKDFPLYTIHPWATRAAIDGNCLAAQSNDAYWSFADYVHANGHEVGGGNGSDALDRITRDQGQKFKVDMDKLNACLKAQDDTAVKASEQEGEALGIEGTPAVFINGFKINGMVPPEEMHTAIDHALRDAGQTTSSLPGSAAGPIASSTQAK